MAEPYPPRGAELECCGDCRQPYTIWYADNDLWNAVMRPPGYTEEPFLCARCFLIRAEPVSEIARVTWADPPSRRDRERSDYLGHGDPPQPLPHPHSCRCDNCWAEAMSEQDSQR